MRHANGVPSALGGDTDAWRSRCGWRGGQCVVTQVFADAQGWVETSLHPAPTMRLGAMLALVKSKSWEACRFLGGAKVAQGAADLISMPRCATRWWLP